MPVVVYVLPTGEERRVQVEEGSTVMSAARDNLVPGIVAECGGELSCGTCHVFVDDEWTDAFPPRSDDEEYMLEVTATEANANSRLSCQLVCTSAASGVVVRIPEEQ